ncbi:hypothetical protein VaNZ11_014863 [Volvox africanus]|uniref:separase n=1 Tax=Volvox africanus TaxID=51714 RepID=A0ABQ5SL28_9CHLO|nr:hypothetical protein VaNZ11_014863 [Volvox africanus]
MADAQALLVTLDGEVDIEKLRIALHDITTILQPLLEFGRSGKVDGDALRPIARIHGPVVTSLIKSMGARLSPDLEHNPEQLVVFGEAVCLGLNALDVLRPVLKASQHELDVQRYNFVRKLAGYGLHEHALVQGKVLLASAAASPGTVAGPGDLHIAAVANLLVCYSALVKQGASRAEILWRDIHCPLDSLLSLARDAAEPHEAAKRLGLVLKCLSKVVETLQYACVVCNLSPRAVAQQLTALIACGVLCRQEQAVQQMLVDDAAAAADTVKLALAEALLQEIASQGSLPEHLLPMLHQLVVSLGQKRTGPVTAMEDRLPDRQPLATIVHAALALPHCKLSDVPDEQLLALLHSLAAAVTSLSANSLPSGLLQYRLCWTCLDGLRVSVASILTQLLSLPQAAGGYLCVLAQCMELLCGANLALLEASDTADAAVALSSGTSAVSIAVRLQVAHAFCTGQVSALQEDMSRYVELLKRLLTCPKQRQRAGSSGGVEMAVFHSLSASLSNAGLDLLQAQHAAPATVLLQAAADLAFERLRQLRALGCLVPEADVLQLIKKCKAHVTALQQLALHGEAMAAAAACVAQLHTCAGGKVYLLRPIIKQFLLSSMANFDAAVAAGALSSAPQMKAPSRAESTAAPAAPCKVQRRRGRFQRMQTSMQLLGSPSAEQYSDQIGPQDNLGWEAALVGQSAVPKAASAVPRALVQSLAAAAVREKGGRPGLLNALDMYAVQELEILREESKRRDEGDNIQLLYSSAVLGALRACANAAANSQILRARELLVKALTSTAALEAQVCDLSASCELLDALVSEMQNDAGALHAADLGLLDSAALAHAQLGLCLAQCQIKGRMADTSAIGHIDQAISLWRRMLAAWVGDGATLLPRMPQATLHAALQVQQYMHLHGIQHPEAARYSHEIIWQLMRGLKAKVKLREQHTYLMSSTMPFTNCTTWLLAVQLTAPLAEIFKDTQPDKKLAEILKVTEALRNAYATDAVDHTAVAAIADSCATELELRGFLRHGSTSMLLRSQCHQLAAAAYLRAGKTSLAYTQAQESLRITCSMFMSIECTSLACKGGSAGSTGNPAPSVRDMTPAEAAAAVVKSGTLASALDYAPDDLGMNVDQQSGGEAAPSSDTLAAIGSSEMRSGRGLTVGLAWAVTAAHLASLHYAARIFEAAGCVEDASCLWRECSRTAELFGAAGVQSLCNSYLAELSCRRGDGEAAAAHIETAGTGVCVDCKDSVAQPSLSAAEAALLTTHVYSARARLALLHENLQMVDEASQKGISTLGIPVTTVHLSDACGLNCTEIPPMRLDSLVWHNVCVRAQLERIRAEGLLRLGHGQEAAQLLEGTLGQLQHAAKAYFVRTAAEVWPVDYGLLLAHQAFARLQATPYSCGSASVVGLGESDSRSAKLGEEEVSSSIPSDTTAGSNGTDQSGKRGGKGKASSGSSKGRSKQQRIPESPDGKQLEGISLSARPGLQAFSCSIPALLQSLELCWQLPLAAVYACRQLLHASIALGLPYAATMFLHLGQGMSYAQEQALQRESRRYACRSVRQPPHAVVSDICTGSISDFNCTAEAVTEDCNSGQKECIIAADVCDSALTMLSGLREDGTSSTNAFLRLETGAERWLHCVFDRLPEGAVVSCVIQDPQARQLLLGRAARGAVPLLAVLPGAYPNSSRHRLSVPSAVESPASQVLDRCVARLCQLLEESGDSMQMDQDAASSQSHKVKWWKTRVSLNEAVKGLLQELDEQCLGPWRCLLLPVPAAHLDIWRAAVDAFIKEHFTSDHGQHGGIGEELCRRHAEVLRELLVVALSGMRHLHGSDVTALVNVICSQLGISGASNLAVELSAVEAAVRVQLLKLRTGSTSVVACDGRDDKGSPGGVPAGRGIGHAAARSNAAGTPAAPMTRARTNPCTQLQGTASTVRLGSRDSCRRLGITSPCAANEHMDADNTQPQSVGMLDAHGRARRASRRPTAQAEPASSQAVACKGPARATCMQLATQRCSGAMVISEDLHSECSGPDAARCASKPHKTPVVSTNTAGGPSLELGGSVLPIASTVLLVLSPALHALPWESIPCCHGNDLYRILNLTTACATAAQLTERACASGNFVGQGEGLGATGRCGSTSASDNNAAPAYTPSAFYVLNPSGDLLDTQRFFKPILEAQPLWEGITGERPCAKTLLAALQSYELFLYFGHGSGEQFLPRPALRKLQRCASCLLMGCSSGRLRLHGAYDPTGAAVAYLLAGCPALVANLWDVTDRDIDRFSQALMHAWLGCTGAMPTTSSTSCSGASTAAKPERACMVRGNCEPLGLAVAHSRSACKLPYLIGAAPVCYGLPQHNEHFPY